MEGKKYVPRWLEHGPGDRVGDSCWWQFAGDTMWNRGKLRAWSTESEKKGVFGPVGIVESVLDGFCYSVPVELICFSEEDPVTALDKEFGVSDSDLGGVSL